MKSLHSGDAYSPTAIVQKYLEDEQVLETVSQDRSLTAQLCGECILLFQKILKVLNYTGPSSSREHKAFAVGLQRSYSRVKIWSDENGITQGNLDEIFTASPVLQRDTFKLISSISRTLTESMLNFDFAVSATLLDFSSYHQVGLVDLVDIPLDLDGRECVDRIRTLATVNVDADSNSSSGSDCSSFSHDSVGEVLEDLKTDTTCLLDLEGLFDNPIIRPDAEPAAFLQNWDEWIPHQAYSDRISSRFPKTTDRLIQRLGKANYERYLRCQEERNNSRSVNPLLEATTSDVIDGASSKFHDSGIGSSLPTTASSYAETIMSYGADEKRRVRVPPLPAQARDGNPFECICCGKWVRIRTTTAWKQHIYGDLRPWVCVYQNCPLENTTFVARQDWGSHLALDHGLDPSWFSIECPLCLCETGEGRLQIMKHLSGHLEEISLAALPGEYDFDEESRASELEYEGADSREDDPPELADEVGQARKEKAQPSIKQTHKIGACVRCKMQRIRVSYGSTIAASLKLYPTTATNFRLLSVRQTQKIQVGLAIAASNWYRITPQSSSTINATGPEFRRRSSIGSTSGGIGPSPCSTTLSGSSFQAAMILQVPKRK